MNIRDATAEDLPDIVEIYTPDVPTRVSAADTETVSVEDRTARFHEQDPSRRPLRVMEDGKGVAGRLGLKPFTAGIFAHNRSSVALFDGFGFETWARFSRTSPSWTGSRETSSCSALVEDDRTKGDA